MKKIGIIFLAVILFLQQIQAQPLPSLQVSSDTRSLGIGGTSIVTTSSYSIENNASLTAISTQKLDAGVSFSLWGPSTVNDKVIGASAWYRTNKLAFGLGFKHFSMPSYMPTSANGVVSQTATPFNPREMAFSLGASYRIVPFLSIGLTARLTNSVMANDAKAMVFGVDLSVTYQKDALTAAVVLANLGNAAKYSETSYPQPITLKAGAAYRILDGLKAQAQADVLFSGAFMAAIGAEYGWKDMLFARAGYHLGVGKAPVPSYLSLGIGAKFYGIHLDVSYLTASKTLGNTVSIGLGYSF